MPVSFSPQPLLAVNLYVAYVIAMLVILGLMAAMIGGLNYVLRVASNFVHGDWAYRRKVLLAVAILLTIALALIGHAMYCIVTDPPS